ncbi:MAG: TRAP transporter small permease [Pseudomonadota bacterium]
MGVSRVFAGLGKIVQGLSKILNVIGISILAVLMFFTVTDVCLRYFFNRPFASSFELTEFMMAVVVSFGLAYTATKGGHIGVDLITSRLPRNVEAGFACVSHLISTGVFALVTWQSFLQAKTLYYSGLESEVLYIPVFPFVAATGFGFALLCLVFLGNFFNSLSRMIEEWNH